MNHQTWLEWRRQGIGASDAPIIMGTSPWKTIDELLDEKCSGVDSQPENDNMRFGKENEEKARLRFEEMTGHVVFPDRKYIHPYHIWIRATLDGIDMEEKIMVEIKNAKKSDHEIAKEGKVPEKYYPQCQHQLFVKSLPYMYYFSFWKDEGIIVEVIRDQSYIEKMFHKEKEFWDRVVEKRNSYIA